MAHWLRPKPAKPAPFLAGVDIKVCIQNIRRQSTLFSGEGWDIERQQREVTWNMCPAWKKRFRASESLVPRLPTCSSGLKNTLSMGVVIIQVRGNCAD